MIQKSVAVPYAFPLILCSGLWVSRWLLQSFRAVFDSQTEYQTMRLSIRVMSSAFQAVLSGVRFPLDAPNNGAVAERRMREPAKLILYIVGSSPTCTSNLCCRGVAMVRRGGGMSPVTVRFRGPV